MAKKSRSAAVTGEKATKLIDLYAIVHRRLTVAFHGVRLTGRVVAAGWKTPLVVCRGDRTPMQFIVIAPDGTPTASSTNPTDTIEIGVHSLTWDEIEWEPPLGTDQDLAAAHTRRKSGKEFCNRVSRSEGKEHG